jgi:hypothetical protein
MSDSREYTSEEVRDMFLQQVASVLNYWVDQKSRGMEIRDMMEGLVHSILVIIDGGSCELPGFTLCPNPAPADKEYLQERGENWFPTESVDIGGGLHEMWHKYCAKKEKGSVDDGKPPAIQDLECLNAFPEGTIGHTNDDIMIKALYSLCSVYGYGRVPQVAAQIEGIWRDRSLIEKHKNVREKLLKMMENK